MVTEDYVSFETAKLLKEKGFHVSDISMLVGNDNHPFISGNSGYEFLLQKGQEVYPAPTLQMAMKWLREIKTLHIMVDCIGSKNYLPTVQNTGNINDYIVEAKYSKLGGNGFDSYEEACEAAIKYCLENLI